MSKPNLVAMPRPLERSVSDLLEEAKGKEYETVIVIGIKDGRSYINSSRWRLSRIEMLGSLEYAKQHIWEA